MFFFFLLVNAADDELMMEPVTSSTQIGSELVTGEPQRRRNSTVSDQKFHLSTSGAVPLVLL